MLIISKHRDYYDKVASTVGVDKTLVYKRDLTEPKEFLVLNFNYKVPSRVPQKNMLKIYTEENHAYTPFIIGFCGKLYVGYKFEWSEIRPHVLGSIQKSIITYDKDEIISILSKVNLHSYLPREKQIVEIKRKIEDIFKFVDGKPYDGIFAEMRVPYFYAEPRYSYSLDANEFVVSKLNPVLSDYKFVKKFDPVTAFQEISMFLGGVLGTNENETVEIDDKYKLLQHGFDKMSFKQASPGQKKENRRLNKQRKCANKNK